MSTKGKRFISAAEPDKGHTDTVLNMGIVKQVTGGDLISARELFERQTAFRPQFTLWCCANDVPGVNDSSDGAWRRMRFIEMTTRFVDGDPTRAHEKRKDPELERKMKKWPEVLLFLLVKEYMKHRGNPMVDIQLVKNANEEFRRECDHFTLFTQRHLQSDEHLELSLDSITDIYTDFCTFENIRKESRLKQHSIKRRLREFGNPVVRDHVYLYNVSILQTVAAFAQSRQQA